MSTSAQISSAYQKFRAIKDHALRYLVGVGGSGVIIAILLIFFYLFYVVAPLFESAEAVHEASFAVDTAEKTYHLDMEEQTEIGVRFTDAGQAHFFSTADGKPLLSQAVIADKTRISAFHAMAPVKPVVAYGLNDGHIVVAKHVYRVTFPDDKRLIIPALEFPLGETPLLVDPRQRGLTHFVFQLGEERHSVAALTEDERLILTTFVKEGSALDEDEAELVPQTIELPSAGIPVDFMVMDSDQRILYVASSDGELVQYDISDYEAPEILQRRHVLADDRKLNDMLLMSGSISLLLADSAGTIQQWFPLREAGNKQVLSPIRQFASNSGKVNGLATEPSRRGFASYSATGQLVVYHATAEQQVLDADISTVGLINMVFSPRANAVLTEDVAGQLHFWRLHNEYPEISWNSLWGKVWYESYQEPEYIWQSSSASNDFEPKFSLTPISFGTIKAAFYAMMIAVPLAILGAMFTAYFMAPRMRRLVKPSIEIMEALPTVILGFLAGLWLAPEIESNMPGIFSLLLVMPIAILVAAWSWTRMPAVVRHAVPEGWEALLLIPVIAIVGWLAIALSPVFEQTFFSGDMRNWLTNEAGISFDQRNAIVVGLAMGFAVIPTIFSIAEDAIFSVPKSLSQGSLALGATPWQTMWRVVLLTASPGIFSAIMIGLGRAVGETMIVLMATGNTPVMDFSIFEGMRTLSANIAVEMPESEVGSTHYRVLFLAALVLFMFTFFFNTVAELVRQRLRRKYSSL